jgi:hypothetical protein
MKTAHQVAKWLKSIHRTQSIRPCVVAIGTDTYEGAMYECVGEYIANMDAIVRGERNVGDVYIQRSIYLVGDVPAVVKERRRTCFTFEGQDWFLASHSGPSTNAPFGQFLVIDPWTVSSKIDDDRPYRRVPMTVKLGRCV